MPRTNFASGYPYEETYGYSRAVRAGGLVFMSGTRGQSAGGHADNAKGERGRNTASRAALNTGPIDLAVYG